MAKNQIERILWLDMAIREGHYPSRREVAERFEVTVKTIERDLDYMRDRLRAPIVYDHTRRGYHYNEEGFFLPQVYLSEGDALALFMAQQLGGAWRDTPLSDSAQKAWSRLSSLLPKEVRVPPSIFSDAITLIDRSVAARTEHWLTLLEGANARIKVRMHYRVPGYTDAVERTIHPYRLVHSRSAWYVLGHDEYRDGVRIFALSRIHCAQKSTETFTRPADFDPSNYIDPDFGAFMGSEWFTAELLAEAATAEVLAERLPARSQHIETLDSGKTKLSFETNQWEELKHWVLQWGEHVEVLEPESLRDELSRIGAFYRERYG